MTATTKTNETPLTKEVLQAQKSYFQLPKRGDIVEGEVLGRERGMLFIDLGMIGTGVVYGVEYFRAQDIIKNLKLGDKISAKLVELENEDGYRELSLKKAEEEKSWQYLEEKKKNQEIVEIKIIDANKGGLLGKIGNLTGFLPVSQLAPANYPRVEGGDKNKILDELRKFIDETMEVQVLDVNPEEEKLIFSQKAAEGEAIEKALKKYKVGDVVEGEITGVVDFGAFIKFDEILEGLIHISELDWSLVGDPKDMIKVGDKVKAKIVDISENKVSLSLKALKENPWEGIDKKYKVGDKLKGIVATINPYGALVRIEDKIQGLVHVSEFSAKDESVSAEENEEIMRSKLEEGKEYEFEILSIDTEEYKISLKLAS
ncbi:MAG: S1 RNA-binding domain-containing protein [Candidatus Spechtbacterales bacterium]